MIQKGNRKAERSARVLFVGQAPGRPIEGKPNRPFAHHSASGKRLIELSGSKTFLDDHDFVNLLDEYPGKGDSNNPHGDAFPIEEARAAARWFVREHTRDDRNLILVGANVVAAFFGAGADLIPFFVWKRGFTKRDFAAIPHPSGVNRFWNDPANARRARKFLRSL